MIRTYTNMNNNCAKPLGNVTGKVESNYIMTLIFFQKDSKLYIAPRNTFAGPAVGKTLIMHASAWYS
jgi:hypothetical protein